MDGLEEDAAQHGTSFAALIAVLIDEGAEVSHGGAKILIQLEICWDLHCHLISLQTHRSYRHGPGVGGHGKKQRGGRMGVQGLVDGTDRGGLGVEVGHLQLRLPLQVFTVSRV